MALEGTLSDFSLADIFQLIGIQSKTGVLTLKNEEATVKVFFRDGRVVNADSQRKGNEDRIGHVLVRTGKITEEELEEVLRIQKETLQQLGHILVSQRHLTAEELQASLRMQVTQVIYRLFRWKEGEYHFDQDVGIEDEAPFEPLTAESILMEGVRMLDEWPLIESRIGSQDLVFRKCHPSAVVDVVAEDAIDRDDDTALRNLIGGTPANVDSRISLTGNEAAVYEKVDGRRDVHEIAETSSLYEFDVCKALYDMAERNLIVEVGAAEPELYRAEAVAVRRDVSPDLVKALYLLAAGWLLFSLATLRYNPLDYWSYPFNANMKVDSFRAVEIRLALEKVSLALEAYKVAHGRYPDKIDALVEDGLVTASEALGPPDAPLTYELKGKGFDLTFARR